MYMHYTHGVYNVCRYAASCSMYVTLYVQEEGCKYMYIALNVIYCLKIN